MRNTYLDQLAELSTQLGQMCGLATTALRRATLALLLADLTLAQQVFGDYEQIAVMRAHCQHHAFMLLALQAPVARDLRTVVSSIQVANNLDRMGALALHIATIAQRRHPEHALPVEIVAHVAEMGRVAIELCDKTEAVLLSGDAHNAARIHAEDDTMDDLHRSLFSIVMAPDWKHGITAAIDVTLLSRFYERFADHTVEVARRVVYHATGTSTHHQRLSTLERKTTEAEHMWPMNGSHAPRVR